MQLEKIFAAKPIPQRGVAGGIAVSHEWDAGEHASWWRVEAETELVFRVAPATVARMSTVQEIEAAIKKLSPQELKRVHEWREDFVEDPLEFTPEFEAEIQASERELTAGLRRRVGRPGAKTATGQ